MDAQVIEHQTEIEVKLTGVHLCCQGCVNAVDAALAGLNGVESWCDLEKGTVAFTAGNDVTAQKALDAIAAAGFFGSTKNEQLAMKAVSDIPLGKVKRVNIHYLPNDNR